MALHRWKMEQHCKAGGALDQRTYCGSVKTDDQVPFPVTRNNTIISLWAATMTTSGVATFILAGSEESEAA
jgi:hypothetical protein